MRLTIRIIISIFALSMFLSCQEETSSGFRQCGIMILSDALPVQFWLSECETFNEHEAGGVHHVCWCHPWNCEDEIVVQFQHTAAQDLVLIVQNSDGEFLFEADFNEIQSGVYQLSFVPEDEDICDDQVKLIIASSEDVQRLLAPNTWDDSFAARQFTSLNGTTFSWIDNASPYPTRIARQPLVIPSGVQITFDISVTISGTFSGSGVFVSFTLTDGLGNQLGTDGLTLLQNGSYTETLTITPNALSTYLEIDVGLLATTGTVSVSVTITPNQVVYINPEQTLAKSDCLEIAESHDETIFIEYSNQTNYAGLIYENDSPDTTFGIRVPSRFFHEVEPEEDEAMELTSSVIITSSQVKTQRLLEVKHAPYYFHKKLRRVLKHQTITIFDKQWKKEEKYEVIEGKKTWPLKAATCLLTEKSSVVRNVS